VFQIGTLDYLEEYKTIRYIGLVIYLVFSWIQVWSFKALGDNYSQDIMIKKNHQLVTKGPFRFVRHPQYLCQILVDLGAAAGTLSFIVGGFWLIEIPIYIMRASVEDKLLAKYFKGSEKASRRCADEIGFHARRRRNRRGSDVHSSRSARA